jgi:ribosomal protein L29
MTKTKKTSFKDKSAVELTKFISEKREALRALRFASAGSRPKDTSAASKARKEVARALTAINAHKA